MLVRSCLAALDHNNNVDREQVSYKKYFYDFIWQSCKKAVALNGSLRYNFDRKRHGLKYTVKPVKVKKDYMFRDYIASLVVKVIQFF